MIKVTIWILFLAGLAYAGFCLFLFLRQRSLIYYPHPAVQSNDGEVVWLDNEQEQLKVWQVDADGDAALIYFGGNAEDVSINLAQFRELFSGVSLYLMNYRGYGGSSGHPTEAGLFSDSIALYNRVAASHKKIILMGRSLGTAVALYLAAEKMVDALILVTPYSSMVDLGQHYYPILPINPLLKDRFESIYRAPEIEVPVLVLVAEHDEIIPAKVSAALVDSFKPGLVQSVVIKGTHHNTIDSTSIYNKSIEKFLDGLLDQKSK